MTRAGTRRRTTTTGSTTARGYGADHQRRRAAIAPAVNAGHYTCWRCHHRIHPGQPWDLGHDDHDRTTYRGPEHQACNRATNSRWRRLLTLTTTRPRTATRW